jgi:hypothetical protein
MGEHQLDLSSEPPDAGEGASPERTRKFLGIHFACCAVYARVYLNRRGTAYEGHCPRCGRQVRLEIGPGGTDCRFFTAY